MRENIQKLVVKFLLFFFVFAQFLIINKTQATVNLNLDVTPTNIVQGNPSVITYTVTFHKESGDTATSAVISTPIPAGTSFNPSFPPTQNGQCFFDGTQNKIYWNQADPPDGFSAQFTVNYPAQNQDNCPDLPVNSELIASYDKTGFVNKNPNNSPDYGLHDLGGSQEVTLSTSNQASFPINVSPGIDYATYGLDANGNFKTSHSALQTYITSGRNIKYHFVMANQSVVKLRDFLNKISGASFTLNGTVTNPNSGIVVALYNDLASAYKTSQMQTALGINNGNYSSDYEEAYYIKTDSTNNRVMIIANTPLGISHAIQMFLRAFGYRRYFMEGTREYGRDTNMSANSKNWEIFPDSANTIKANLHLLDRPYLTIRYWSAEGSDRWNSTPTAVEDWTSWYQAIFAKSSGGPSHAYQALFGGYTFRGGEFSGQRGYQIFCNNPWFLLGYTTDQNSSSYDFSQEMVQKICAGTAIDIYKPNFSNSHVRDLWLQYAKERIDTDIDTIHLLERYVALSPDDGNGWYLENLPVRKPDGSTDDNLNWYEDWYNSTQPSSDYTLIDNWDYHSVSDQAYGIANWMYYNLKDYRSNEIKLNFGILAYYLHSQPPHMRVHPNVEIYVLNEYCGYAVCGIDITKRFIRWAYTNFPNGRKIHYSIFNNIKEDVHDYFPSMIPTTVDGFESWLNSKILVSTEVSGVNRSIGGMKTQIQADMGLGGLGYYLLAFGTWNPQLNFDVLRQDFLDKNFGASGPADNCDLSDNANASVRGCMKKYYDTISIENMESRTLNNYGKAIQLLDRAYGLATDIKVKYRINDLKYNWYYIYLTNRIRNDDNKNDAQTKLFDYFFTQGKSYMTSWENLTTIMYQNGNPGSRESFFSTSLGDSWYQWFWPWTNSTIYREPASSLNVTPRKWNNGSPGCVPSDYVCKRKSDNTVVACPDFGY